MSFIIFFVKVVEIRWYNIIRNECSVFINWSKKNCFNSSKRSSYTWVYLQVLVVGVLEVTNSLLYWIQIR